MVPSTRAHVLTIYTCTCAAAAGVCTPYIACTEGRRPVANCSQSTWGLAAKLSHAPTLWTCSRGPTETVPLSHSPAPQHKACSAAHCTDASSRDDVLCFTYYAEEIAKDLAVSMVAFPSVIKRYVSHQSVQKAHVIQAPCSQIASSTRAHIWLWTIGNALSLHCRL